VIARGAEQAFGCTMERAITHAIRRRKIIHYQQRVLGSESDFLQRIAGGCKIGRQVTLRDPAHQWLSGRLFSHAAIPLGAGLVLSGSFVLLRQAFQLRHTRFDVFDLDGFST
jgi:hypothetical protein